MTIRELIEQLKMLPPDLVVKLAVQDGTTKVAYLQGISRMSLTPLTGVTKARWENVVLMSGDAFEDQEE